MSGRKLCRVGALGVIPYSPLVDHRPIPLSRTWKLHRRGVHLRRLGPAKLGSPVPSGSRGWWTVDRLQAWMQIGDEKRLVRSGKALGDGQGIDCGPASQRPFSARLRLVELRVPALGSVWRRPSRTWICTGSLACAIEPIRTETSTETSTRYSTGSQRRRRSAAGSTKKATWLPQSFREVPGEPSRVATGGLSS